ncbi:hypothetical protein T484DRAFT_1750705 [Baffinella frigidus]|nr:hypothetical protein T484DRAFT_1750705 [Cryptophyta sp. CCMP2293]
MAGWLKDWSDHGKYMGTQNVSYMPYPSGYGGYPGMSYAPTPAPYMPMQQGYTMPTQSYTMPVSYNMPMQQPMTYQTMPPVQYTMPMQPQYTMPMQPQMVPRVNYEQQVYNYTVPKMETKTRSVRVPKITCDPL